MNKDNMPSLAKMKHEQRFMPETFTGESYKEQLLNNAIQSMINTTKQHGIKTIDLNKRRCIHSVDEEHEQAQQIIPSFTMQPQSFENKISSLNQKLNEQSTNAYILSTALFSSLSFIADFMVGYIFKY